MKKLYSVAWVFIVLAMPTFSKAASNNDHKTNHRFDLFVPYLSNFTKHEMYSSTYSHDSGSSNFDDKAIIKNAVPSHGSFQDVSIGNSVWLTEFGYGGRKNEQHENSHWSSWIGQDQHGNGHENWQWTHHGREGEFCVRDRDDDPVTLPVPEPSTYMLMLLGVISFGFLKRRQF